MNKAATTKKSDNAISSVYLFSGEVDARRDSEVDALVARMVDPGSTVFDLSRFDGDNATAEGIISAAMTLPLSSERKVVIVSRVDRLSADDQGKIAAFLPKIGPMNCLILTTSEEAASQKSKSSSSKKEDEDESGEDGKKKQKKGLQSGLVKAVKARGKVVDFGRLRAEDLSAIIAKSAKSLGKAIEPSALQSITRSLAANPSSIESELAKLATYIGDRDKIVAADVDAVLTKSPEERVFPLIDAIAARRPDMALQMMDETMAASAKVDSEVLKIISMLARHFRLLYQMKFLKSQGIRSLASVPEDLHELLAEDSKSNPLSMADWQRNKLADQSNAFGLEELETCIKQILTCELATKGIGKGDGSPRLNLEMLIFKLSRRKPR